MRTFVSGLVALFCILTLTPRADAQSTHAATPSAIDQALQQHLDSDDADRALVLRVLEQPAVRTLAAELGVDVIRARSAVATLDGEALDRLAAQASQVDQALAGGQGSVTISYTLIIVGLLVLILLILLL
jgi:pyruvate/2-oxoglutarate dehydrogenase complex dihydrolipoamide acyltransferase (E2) component